MVVYIVFLTCFPVHAQAEREDFFIAPLTEVIGYSFDTIAYGTGLCIGYGSGNTIGIRLLYAGNPEKFIFMEVLFFLRLYLSRSGVARGFFIQLNSGPVIYAHGRPERTGYGNISAGFSAGWRFFLGKQWFIEPAVRAGFPYVAGGGISAGLRLQ
jgi:hypothetical protein